MPLTLIKTRQEALDLSDQEIAKVWENMPQSPFRHVVEYEFEARKLDEMKKLSAMKADEFQKQQGIVEGIGIAVGILNRKDR